MKVVAAKQMVVDQKAEGHKRSASQLDIHPPDSSLGSDIHSTSAHEIELKPEEPMQPIQPIAMATGSRFNPGDGTELTGTPNKGWNAPATSQGIASLGKSNDTANYSPSAKKNI